jgi:hypothetical protein
MGKPSAPTEAAPPSLEAASARHDVGAIDEQRQVAPRFENAASSIGAPGRLAG